MSQERLNALTILPFEKKELSKQIDYKTVPDDFASKIARKVNFK